MVLNAVLPFSRDAALVPAIAGSFDRTEGVISGFLMGNQANILGRQLTISKELSTNHWCAHRNQTQQNVEPRIILFGRNRCKFVLEVLERVINDESRGSHKRVVVLGICLDALRVSKMKEK